MNKGLFELVRIPGFISHGNIHPVLQIEAAKPEILSQKFSDEEMHAMIGGKPCETLNFALL